MPSNLVFEDNSQQGISSLNLGAVGTGTANAQITQLYLANIGTTPANGVTLTILQRSGSDGYSYAYLAPDDGTGNPSTFSNQPLFLGDIDAGAQVSIWVQVSPPNGVTQFGNPRQFVVDVEYTGT